MKTLILTFFAFAWACTAHAQDLKYDIKQNIPYYAATVSQQDKYQKEQCVLDVYYPTNAKSFATIVWFHGGGLSGGTKEIPEALKAKGVCVVGVGYRLSPLVKSPKYIEDAAAAVSWVFNHITSMGGDTSLIFLSGHSAGGYLSMMLGLDKKYLGVYAIDANRLAGLIPFSGQAITHFTIRKESGIPETQPVIDSMAPLNHVRADCSPMLLITGDRELELLGRYEENAYLLRMMKLVGNTTTRLYELDGYGHSMADPAYPLLLKEVQRIVEQKKGK